MVAHGINMVRVPVGWWNVLHFSELPEVGVGPAWVAMPPSAEVRCLPPLRRGLAAPPKS